MKLVEYDVLIQMEGGEQRGIPTGMVAFIDNVNPSSRITVEWDEDRQAIKIYKQGFNSGDEIHITPHSINVILIK